jgi:hypothetical protein
MEQVSQFSYFYVLWWLTVYFFLFRHGLLIISALFMPDQENFAFQTQWMAGMIMTRDENNEVYGLGLVSDVAYWFFKNGYLLSTSRYCKETSCWIPILLTWIRGLSKSYYQVHFATLLQQFAGLPQNKCDILVHNVVDFSLAQTNGFISAYTKVFGITDQAAICRKLKGCQQHFNAQIT